MGTLTIVYWRDIPAQVIAEADGTTVRRQLAQRMQEAIDSAAMRVGAHETDDYLASWRRADPVPCGDDAESEADAAVLRLEAEYDEARLDRLIEAGGHEEG